MIQTPPMKSEDYVMVWTKRGLRFLDQVVCWTSTESLNKKWKYMKAPRQWINTWQKEDLKRPDLVNWLYACDHSLK